MNQNSVTGDIVNLKLRQLNPANITQYYSDMYLVNFDLENDMRVSYVFNITKEDRFFLQRMQPYAMVHGKFADGNEIVRFIEQDIAKFRNANKSHNFTKYVNVSSKCLQVSEEVEKLFLNYNVDGHYLQILEEQLDEIMQQIKGINTISNPVELHQDDTDH